MKNYEVIAVLTTSDENGKPLKKKETILVTGAVSCADAEFRVMTEKEKLGGFECTIVSSKETKLSLFAQPESDEIDVAFYKITVLYAVNGEGDKLKFERESKLVLSKSAIDAICTLASSDEVVSVSKSQIVEVIEVGE